MSPSVPLHAEAVCKARAARSRPPASPFAPPATHAQCRLPFSRNFNSRCTSRPLLYLARCIKHTWPGLSPQDSVCFWKGKRNEPQPCARSATRKTCLEDCWAALIDSDDRDSLGQREKTNLARCESLGPLAAQLRSGVEIKHTALHASLGGPNGRPQCVEERRMRTAVEPGSQDMPFLSEAVSVQCCLY